MSKKKKLKEVNMKKAFASEFGIEGMLMNKVQQANAFCERRKQLKALKKSKKYKKKAKELNNSD